MFIMSLGEFGDIWDALPSTEHNLVGEISWLAWFVLHLYVAAKIHFFFFIALLVILLLNLLIAMMGDTYAKASICYSMITRLLKVFYPSLDCWDKEWMDEAVG